MTRHSSVPVYGLLILSGFAGLGYQSVWTRMIAQATGHEYVAVLGVVAAFFCGLSLGSYVFDGRVSRSLRPGAWYAGLEVVIGLWALLLIALIPAVNALIPQFLGPTPGPLAHWLTAFLIPFVLLLPATAAMGATLPAAERLVARLQRDGSLLGGVYGANTFGAMVGAVLTTFFIAPQIGHGGTLVVLALMNFICAGALMLGPAKGEAARPPVTVDAQGQTGAIGESFARGHLLGVLFATGLLGIGYEVVIVRALAQILENTVFSFASVLSAYLLGTSLGAALYHRFTHGQGATSSPFWLSLPRLLQIQAGACLAGILSLAVAPDLYAFIRGLSFNPTATAIAAEIASGLLVFLIPTMVMGAVFTALAQRLRTDRGGVGLALAVNTLGAACAPALFGIMILPLAGVIPTLAMIAMGYLFLMPAFRPSMALPTAGVAGVSVLMVTGVIAVDLLKLPKGARLRERIEGVMGTVTVYDDQAGNTHLKINNHYVMGGTASLVPDRRQGHTPLMMHPDPRRALFLGVGTGATFAAAAHHPNLAAEAVELVPEVLDVLPHFASVSGEVTSSPNLTVHAGDARRYVAASSDQYDVIIADTFHPSRDGAGLLYTAEHFDTIRARLAGGGLFCQWLPLHQLDLPTLKVIIRTFLSVYPDGFAVLNDFSLATPVIGLVGTKGTLALNPVQPENETLQQALMGLKIASPVQPLQGYLGDGQALSAFAGPGPLNTDDHPLVLFRAPRSVYHGLDAPAVRLMAILESLERKPASALNLAEMAERVDAYWTARDAFLALGAEGMAQASNPDEMIRKVARPLLEMVRTSPDFAPAYDPLVAMAAYLARQHPQSAKGLLLTLREANPTRSEAGVLLARHFGIMPGLR